MNSRGTEDRVFLRVGLCPVRGRHSRHMGRVNLGLDYQANRRTTFTASAGYRQGFDGDSHGYDAMLRFKINF